MQRFARQRQIWKAGLKDHCMNKISGNSWAFTCLRGEGWAEKNELYFMSQNLNFNIQNFFCISKPRIVTQSSRSRLSRWNRVLWLVDFDPLFALLAKKGLTSSSIMNMPSCTPKFGSKLTFRALAFRQRETPVLCLFTVEIWHFWTSWMPNFCQG